MANVLHLHLPCLKNSCHRPLGWIHDWDWKWGPRYKWSACYLQVVVTISIHQILWYVSTQAIMAIILPSLRCCQNISCNSSTLIAGMPSPERVHRMQNGDCDELKSNTVSPLVHVVPLLSKTSCSIGNW